MKEQKVLKIADMLEYQEDAVVSSEIIKNSAGTVTLFAFDRGQGLSEHTAPFDALVHVVDGSAEVHISGERYAVGSGEIIIMPAGKPHSINAVERFKMLLVMVKESR